MCQLLERRNNGNEIEPVHFVPVLFYTFCTFRTGSILHATFLKNGTKKPGPKCLYNILVKRTKICYIINVQ